MGEAEENGEAAPAQNAELTQEDFFRKGKVCESIEIECDGDTAAAAYDEGFTILETARHLGLHPPSSCLSGNCATCIAKLTHGTAIMWFNDVLTPQDVADGYILTCQAVPTAKSVKLVYGD